MKTNNISLPIFPLPIFLLPEGVTKLRIFEPRYLKMISIASQGSGFVIWSKNAKNSLSNSLWGSWVEIINFDQGQDGILEVDVKCKALVELSVIDTDSDNLYFGDIKEINHWSQTDIDSSIVELSTSLADVFDNNPSLSELYPHKAIDRPSWVIARWLELLPINIDVKTTFIAEHNFQAAKELVQSVINQ
jgi:Lon protease-like protein